MTVLEDSLRQVARQLVRAGARESTSGRVGDPIESGSGGIHDGAGRRTGRVKAAAVFAGRATALETVVAALDGEPRLVLIEGEAGIGKTRLVREALDTWSQDDRVLELACPALQVPFPLGPVIDALHGRGLTGIELSPLGGALRPLFPEWAEELPPALEPPADPGQTRHRLFRAIIEWIERRGVTAVVVEDAQWADDSTLDLLIMLTSVCTSPPTILITYRSTDLPDGSSLLNLTSRTAVLTPVRIELGPLDLAATRTMIAAVFETSEVSEQFGRFILDHTGGIPLALEESLSLLRDRGDIVFREGEWTRSAVEDLQVPPTFRDSVLERVQRLAPVTRRVLAAASVLATPAIEELLGSVADLSQGETRGGVAQAIEAGLLDEATPGMFGFRHVLASRAVADSVAISARRHLHLRAATALRAIRPQPVRRLSRHYREANRPTDWSTFAEAAADLALQSGDDRAAVELLLEVATAGHHPAARRTHLARRLGEAATWGVGALGDLGARVTTTLAAAVSADCPAEVRGEIRLLLGRLLLQWGEFEQASAQIEAAVEELGDHPGLVVRAMVSLAWPRGRETIATTHLGWLGRATEANSRVPADVEGTWFDVDRASVLMMLGDVGGWAEAEVLRRDPPASLDGRRQVARLLMNMGHVAIAWGRDDDAGTVLTEAVDQMRTTGYHRLVNSARLTAAHLDWQAGRWKGLAERVDRLASEEETLPEAILEARYVLALLGLAGGERQAAEEQLAELVRETSRRALVDAQVPPAAAWAGSRLAANEPGVALEILAPVVDVVAGKGMWLWAGPLAPTQVEALVATGDPAEARRFTAAFAAGTRHRDLPAPAAALRTCQGVILESEGKLRDAAGAYADTARMWAGLPRPYEVMLSRERELRCRLGSGRGDREVLAKLRNLEHRLREQGARWDADRIAQLLRRHGIDVVRTWRGGRRGYGDALSPRELEVVRLVAQGLTNRAAAETLFLSPRTIERHLSAAMRKLKVSSRTALALAAAEAGLLSRGGITRGSTKIG